MSEPIDAFDAVMRLEEGLDDAIEPIVEYWRLHEREMPRELARLIERLAEVKAECDAASMLIRFNPFNGRGVKIQKRKYAEAIEAVRAALAKAEGGA